MTKAGAVQGGVPVRRGRCRDGCPKASFWGETPGLEGEAGGPGEAGSAPWLDVCTQHCGPHRAVAACELTLGPRCGLQGAGREGRPRRSLLGQGKLQGCAFKKCETRGSARPSCRTSREPALRLGACHGGSEMQPFGVVRFSLASHIQGDAPARPLLQRILGWEEQCVGVGSEMTEVWGTQDGEGSWICSQM